MMGLPLAKRKRRQMMDSHSLSLLKVVILKFTSKRSFKEHWLVGRSWLSYDKEKVIMKCTACASHYKDLASLNPQAQVWVTGTVNFKIDTIKSLESSKMHEDSIKAVANKLAVDKSEAAAAIKQLNAANYTKMSYMFRNAHAIAKHHKSFKDYVWMCDLDKAKGLETGDTYQNDKQAKIFIENIASVESKKTRVAQVCKMFLFDYRRCH